ncbi:MAG TPA: hypothetical protein VE665_10270, partial [Hyphomicrobiaceae bacterium]|nr:hypothetical protein [Hyphomicrobiaceae bacterium]
WAMSRLGHGALFLHSAAVHLLIAGVMIIRVRFRPRLPAERSEEFVAVPRTTPAVFELDPRSESHGAPDTATGAPMPAGVLGVRQPA